MATNPTSTNNGRRKSSRGGRGPPAGSQDSSDSEHPVEEAVAPAPETEPPAAAASTEAEEAPPAPSEPRGRVEDESLAEANPTSNSSGVEVEEREEAQMVLGSRTASEATAANDGTVPVHTKQDAAEVQKWVDLMENKPDPGDMEAMGAWTASLVSVTDMGAKEEAEARGNEAASKPAAREPAAKPPAAAGAARGSRSEAFEEGDGAEAKCRGEGRNDGDKDRELSASLEGPDDPMEVEASDAGEDEEMEEGAESDDEKAKSSIAPVCEAANAEEDGKEEAPAEAAAEAPRGVPEGAREEEAGKETGEDNDAQPVGEGKSEGEEGEKKEDERKAREPEVGNARAVMLGDAAAPEKEELGDRRDRHPDRRTRDTGLPEDEREKSLDRDSRRRDDNNGGKRGAEPMAASEQVQHAEWGGAGDVSLQEPLLCHRHDAWIASLMSAADTGAKEEATDVDPGTNNGTHSELASGGTVTRILEEEPSDGDDSGLARAGGGGRGEPHEQPHGGDNRSVPTFQRKRPPEDLWREAANAARPQPGPTNGGSRASEPEGRSEPLSPVRLPPSAENGGRRERQPSRPRQAKTVGEDSVSMDDAESFVTMDEDDGVSDGKPASGVDSGASNGASNGMEGAMMDSVSMGDEDGGVSDGASLFAFQDDTHRPRSLSAWNLFYRFKRQMILEARSDDRHPTKEDIQRLVETTPGLEHMPSDDLAALTPDRRDELRRANVRRVLAPQLLSKDQSQRRHCKSANGGFEFSFVEMGALMAKAWNAVDSDTRALFQELANEGKREAEGAPGLEHSLIDEPRKQAHSFDEFAFSGPDWVQACVESMQLDLQALDAARDGRAPQIAARADDARALVQELADEGKREWTGDMLVEGAPGSEHTESEAEGLSEQEVASQPRAAAAPPRTALTTCTMDTAASIDKKRRLLDDAKNQALPPGRALPAEIWAMALEYLPLDNVLWCAAASKFFRDDVTRQIKCLHVTSGGSMDVSSAVIERFGRVEKVFIYFIEIMDQGPYTFHLDSAALQHAARFLSALPALSYCYCGGKTGVYDVYRETDTDDPNPNMKHAEFIRNVCQAYRTGKLSGDANLEYVLPVQYNTPERQCVWRNIPKSRRYRGDVPCQVCDEVCMSFPPELVVAFDDMFIPCIKPEDRLQIVRLRDEKGCHEHVTKAFLSTIREGFGFMPVISPDDFESKRCALSCDDSFIDTMRFLISHGADVDYHQIGNCFTKKSASSNNASVLYLEGISRKYNAEAFLGEKRIIMHDTYKGLRNLGFDIKEEDCVIINDNDPRTDWMLFSARKVREKLVGGAALSEIEEVRDHAKIVIKQRCERDVLKEVKSSLELWLGADLIFQQEQLQLLIVECCKN